MLENEKTQLTRERDSYKKRYNQFKNDYLTLVGLTNKTADKMKQEINQPINHYQIDQCVIYGFRNNLQ